MGIITANLNWKYVSFLPYAYPNLTVSNIMQSKGDLNKMVIFDQAIYNSLICGAIVFVIGYFLVAKKTIK